MDVSIIIIDLFFNFFVKLNFCSISLKDLNKSKKITSTLIDMGVRIGRLMEVTKKATDPSSIGGKEISQLEKEKIYKAIKDVEGKISDLKFPTFTRNFSYRKTSDLSRNFLVTQIFFLLRKTKFYCSIQ